MWIEGPWSCGGEVCWCLNEEISCPVLKVATDGSCAIRWEPQTVNNSLIRRQTKVSRSIITELWFWSYWANFDIWESQIIQAVYCFRLFVETCCYPYRIWKLSPPYLLSAKPDDNIYTSTANRGSSGFVSFGWSPYFSAKTAMRCASSGSGVINRNAGVKMYLWAADRASRT